jgi:hypothetical protein
VLIVWGVLREKERVVKGSTEVMSILLFLAFLFEKVRDETRASALHPFAVIIQHTLPCKEGSQTRVDPVVETDFLRFLHP